MPLKKLRGRSVTELRERSLQLAHRWLERARLADANECSDQEFLARMARGNGQVSYRSFGEWLDVFTRSSARGLTAAFHDPAATLSALRSTAPEREAEVLASAQDILAGRFDLLGYHDVTPGEPIDWHQDPRLRKRSRLRHWSRIDFLNASKVGDHKLIWELNRHQFVFVLGPAYWYTADERYAKAFFTLLESWMDANPPKLGINWASSLEVSFRAMSWLWGLSFFKQSPHLTPPLFGRILKFLDMHARHIETYPSTYFSPNTHLTGEALGLLLLGTQLPELEGAARWRDTGWRLLTDWFPRHTRPDGVYVEQATHYERYTIDFLVLALIVAERHGLPGHATLRDVLGRLLDHVLFLHRPDGTIPLTGDEDGGSLLSLDGLSRDNVRAQFAAGAVLLERGDLAWAAVRPPPSLIWLFGPSGAERFRTLPGRPPAATSRAFPHGGVFVMRDGWSPDADVLSINCGPHGFKNGGHAHADALAVELTVKGVPLLVDAGTYTYTTWPKLRDQYRSSLVHNTVSIDGESSSLSDGPFAWRHMAHAHFLSWQAFEHADYFEGWHDGYARLADPVRLSRAVFFLKGDYWVIRDVLSAAGEHDVCLVFQCAPGIGVETMHDGAVDFRHAEQSLLRMSVFGPRDTLAVDIGQVSRAYGTTEDAPRFKWRAKTTGHASFISLLARSPSAGAWPAAKHARSGRAEIVSIATPSWRDTIIWDGHDVEYDGVRTDARLLWIRRAPTGQAESFVAVHGTQVEIDGRPLAPASDHLRAMSGRHVNGEWRVTEGTSRHPTRSALADAMTSVSGIG